MAKKITPDPPPVRGTLSTADKDRYLRQTTDSDPTSAPALLLDTLAFTTSKPVTPAAPDKPTLFAIQPGITAQDALTYVSHLLETAELNGDEIGLHDNPVERALFWNMLHSLEVARAVVCALLDGSPVAGRQPVGRSDG
ncbi:hypothetical protein [Pseudomonas asplenii]|uniref:hypothetical protein n=1 Tax=Pseudomonas asplenii TaxID=53407 RepID=UPI002234D7FB|nr:hypothetical protein [Pseudomonas asplenii]UZE31150.1 hypothetical protein LOY63_10655 [Pseudomonas asplenii]